MLTMTAQEALSSEQIIALAQRYLIGNYTRYPVCLVRGSGSWVWDAEGHRYLDFFPGWGCGLIGHCPPRVVQAVQEQVATLIHVPNTWYTEPQVLLAKELGDRTGFGGRSFFCNSGTEANEAAIKLARLNGKPKGKYKVVTLTGSFHGRTMGALTATAQPKYHAGVEPMLPGFNYATYGDLDAVAKAIDSETCAILLEPIQGEGGINIPPPGFLEGIRELCDKHGLLMILDEVQTGMGRTGKWYAYQNWNIEPDIVTLAKALAGGVAMGGLVAKPEVAEKLKPGTHAATFGGNPIAARAALATIETIEQEGLLERAIHIGSTFQHRFTELQHSCPIIAAVRVRGAMIGLELKIEGTPIVQECLRRGLLINCTQQTVLRLLPALNITDEEIEHGCNILADVLRNVRSS
ncbi:MAG: aspartate aminotransferase family protein [Gemmataceae bacterium]|nr:aspartate aminotransferase family protein [Gemmata sp.]MDW8199089.1 aspartate aminotransferase family protein [Gemmataceae bacterium]